MRLEVLVLFFCASVLGAVHGSIKHKHLKLELVQVLFRHGERTPQADEAKLIVNATRSLQEPWGFSQLTNKGKQQEYRLGSVLRDLYSDHLGNDYRPEYVYAQSTNFDRTKVSLQLVLASLYLPSENLIWNDNLQWLPIPINFLPRKLDNLFQLDQCQKYTNTYKRLMRSTKIQDQLQQYEDLFQFLQENYPSIIFDLKHLFFMNTFLNILKTLNVPAPEWYTPDIHTRITEGAKFYLDTLSYNPTLIRMNGGTLVRRMIENMALNGKPNPRKIYLYSAHEFTVYALAKAHNITLEKSPAYGSALIFEKLREEVTGELFIRLLYWTGVTEELVQLRLADSGYTPIKEYLNLVKSSITTDEEMRCLYKFLSPRDLERFLKTDSYTIST